MFQSITTGGRSAAGVLVIGQAKGKSLHASDKARDADGSVADALKRPEASGETGSIAEAFPAKPAGRGKRQAKGPDRIVALGLGEAKTLDTARLRSLGGTLGRHLAKIKATSAEIDLRAHLKDAKLDETAAMSAFAEGLGLIGWTYDTLRGSATTKKEQTRLRLSAPTKASTDGLDRGLGLAASANRCRDLSQTPPNIAHTEYMAAQARKLGRETGLKVTVIKGKQLDDLGLTGIKTVGQASEHEGCLIRIEYSPPRASKRAKPAVLIGKTIIYDSGGLSIKVGGSMRGMKRDKDGGCAVFGAMHAIATVIKPKRRVVAFLATAENAISDEAYRPDDVLTFMNGVTVEVTNTDAEGRLVLADALCYACKHENPDYIVDLATLTGGVVVALGSTYAGLWCEDDKLRGKLDAAAAASGERVWQLPHHQEYNDLMRSPVADIHNSAPVREAISSVVPWTTLPSISNHSSLSFFQRKQPFSCRLHFDATAFLPFGRM
ncbi:MAG: leucyl aminopeptidase family protein [Planctomycetota bacterium]